MPNATLIILNPKAGSGRAGRLWAQLEPLMHEYFGDLLVAITSHPEQVSMYLEKARKTDITRVISVGGDGTSHSIINALMNSPDSPPMIFGQLPIGTGQDFARSLNIPHKPEDAIHWLAQAHAKPIDLGCVRYGEHRHHFLNIASAGVSGEVDRRVDGKVRYPWTFWLATVRSLLAYRQPQVRIWVDDQIWYEGKFWLLAVANGSIFGRGMRIAPNARIDDGLFDVVLVKAAPRGQVVRAFNSVYSAKHLEREEVALCQGKRVKIESLTDRIPLDLDGEPRFPESTLPLIFEIKSKAIHMLCEVE